MAMVIALSLVGGAGGAAFGWFLGWFCQAHPDRTLIAACGIAAAGFTFCAQAYGG